MPRTPDPAAEAKPPHRAAPLTPANPSAVGQLLARPDFERAREHRYRFGQSLVFGLPVIALEIWGTRLGGREAARWVGALQALLAGWVLYVGAAGMLFEGLILLQARRRWTGGLAVAAAAGGLYVFSLIMLARLLLGYMPASGPLFHWVVVLLGAWSAWGWGRFARRVRAQSH
jgi:hypothetical protein